MSRTTSDRYHCIPVAVCVACVRHKSIFLGLSSNSIDNILVYVLLCCCMSTLWHIYRRGDWVYNNCDLSFWFLISYSSWALLSLWLEIYATINAHTYAHSNADFYFFYFLLNSKYTEWIGCHWPKKHTHTPIRIDTKKTIFAYSVNAQISRLSLFS